MSKYAVMPLRDYVDACNYIRGITGKMDKIKSGRLIEEIEEVSNKRTTEGYEQGLEEGRETGKQTAYDELWDSIQDKGNKTDYTYFFMGWNGDTFYPKYDFNLAKSSIHAGSANIGIFRNFNKGGKIFDLTERLENCGVVLNTSEVANFQYFMLGANISRIPTIDLTNCTNAYMALYDTEIETIDKLVFSENTPLIANTFQYNDRLTTITEIEGVIAKSVSFQHSPLNVSTMNRIMAHLKDYSSIGGTYTLTLKKDRENMLTAEEKAVATNKGWSLVWI